MLKRKMPFGIKRLFSFFIKSKPVLIDKRSKGVFAEDQAAAFLKCKRIKVLARNWRSGRDEIDIIAKDGKVLVFIEVRARSEDALVPGFYTVNARKKKALLRVCKAYLMSLKAPSKHFRFDVVEVRLGPGLKSVMINHYENVSLFSKHFFPQ